MSNKLEIKNSDMQINNNDRKTISISKYNYTVLKKLGYATESDSMNETISKILAKIPGAYQVDMSKEGSFSIDATAE